MARQIYQAIVDGILVGGVYALMAVGLTLIFGVLDIINIAQGVLVILGAYLSYTLSVRIHLDLFLGLLITVPAMFVLGVAIQWAFIRRLRGRERTSMTLLVTYAVALIIEAAAPGNAIRRANFAPLAPPLSVISATLWNSALWASETSTCVAVPASNCARTSRSFSRA